MVHVHVEQVSKRYGKSTVLQDISLTVQSGEILGLIGPSGSGKTTLVKCMVGMEFLDQGSVKLLDQSMPNRTVFSRIGYMAQSDALYEDLTARENLVFFGRLFGLKGRRLTERIAYVSMLVDLADDLQKRVSNYSGGMKRRLSLAIACIQDPELLILDEPTVGIDPELRLQVWTELNQLRAQRKSIVITTHVMDEAEKCDRLALIRRGKLISIGVPAELKEKYNVETIEEVFLVAGGEHK